MGSAISTTDVKMRVLVIDDEKNIRTTLAFCTRANRLSGNCGSKPPRRLEALDRQAYDLAFLDVRLGQSSGLELIPKLIAGCPNLMVVVVTAYATIDSAVEAIKRGAADYLAKPFTPAQIRHIVDQSVKPLD